MTESVEPMFMSCNQPPNRPLQRILYVGYLEPGQTSLQRMNALASLGYTLDGVNVLGPVTPAGRWRRRIAGLLFRKGLPVPLPDLMGVNRRICELAAAGWDVLWLDKPMVIRTGTIEHFRRANPRALVIAYSPDDMFGRHNQSVQFLSLLPHLDAFITTKSYNVAELESLGCRRVYFIDNAFDPATHRPIVLAPGDRERFGGAIGFIGDYEADRARQLNHLAAAGLPVRIWGPSNWRRFRHPHPNLRIENREVLGDDYARAICAFDINLCFLRKINRDLQTTRSVEIPACGAFMLAERTPEQARLFIEDEEAVFFSTPDELLAKVRHYLGHEEERRRIAAAGRRRCIEDGYDNASRLRAVIQAIERDAFLPTDSREQVLP